MRGSIRDVYIGWVAGDGLARKGYSSKLWEGTSEAQKPAWMGCAGSLMAEMKHNLHLVFALLNKQQHWILPVSGATIRAFHITIN